MAITLINGKQHNVIKRDGRVEPFSWDKLDKVLMWAATYKTGLSDQMARMMVEEIKKNMNLRIYDKIKIERLFNETIDVAANLADRMYPEYDLIARNLFIQKIYKETWGIKRDEYPDYKEVVKKGLQYGVYGEAFEVLDENEIKVLGAHISSEWDFYFASFLGISTFFNKYCKNYTKTKKLELPQHAMMRIAIQAFYTEPKLLRTRLIIDFYNTIKKHLISRATPYYINAGGPKPMLSSCVLVAAGDDSYSINKACHNIGMYSREGGGTALDISPIRSIDSVVDKTGKSSGKIPFIKMVESVISAYNQKSARPGACAIYYNWWDYEIMDLLMLKDEGGSEEKRARKLQYAIKLNDIFIKLLLFDRDIYLFDPKDVPELLEANGQEFTKLYFAACAKPGIRKKKIKAAELGYLIAKIRNETGNLYIFFDDNANQNTPFNKYIRSSNLCTEIFIPTEPTYLNETSIQQTWGQEKPEIKTSDYGEIALCNLTSINAVEWAELSEDEKENVAYMLCRAFDNEIDNMYYAAREGEITNKLYRTIGIGVNGLAAYFAFNKVKFTDPESYKLEFNLFEDIYYHIYKAAIKLAKERGPFERFKETKWADGWLPIDYFENEFDKYTTIEQKSRWEELREEIKRYGIRFATVGAIPPGVTSSIFLVNATESTEPVKQLVATKTGTYSCKQFVPKIREYGMYYQTAWEIPNSVLLKHAQIRQMFIDQGQSINTYTENPDSARETMRDIIEAHMLGLKSLYYLNMRKGEVHEACENCSS